MPLANQQTKRQPYSITVRFRLLGPGHQNTVERTIRSLGMSGIAYEIVAAECELEPATIIRQGLD